MAKRIKVVRGRVGEGVGGGEVQYPEHESYVAYRGDLYVVVGHRKDIGLVQVRKWHAQGVASQMVPVSDVARVSLYWVEGDIERFERALEGMRGWCRSRRNQRASEEVYNNLVASLQQDGTQDLDGGWASLLGSVDVADNGGSAALLNMDYAAIENRVMAHIDGLPLFSDIGGRASTAGTARQAALGMLRTVGGGFPVDMQDLVEAFRTYRTVMYKLASEAGYRIGIALGSDVATLNQQAGVFRILQIDDDADGFRTQVVIVRAHALEYMFDLGSSTAAPLTGIARGVIVYRTSGDDVVAARGVYRALDTDYIHMEAETYGGVPSVPREIHRSAILGYYIAKQDILYAESLPSLIGKRVSMLVHAPEEAYSSVGTVTGVVLGMPGNDMRVRTDQSDYSTFVSRDRIHRLTVMGDAVVDANHALVSWSVRSRLGMSDTPINVTYIDSARVVTTLPALRVSHTAGAVSVVEAGTNDEPAAIPRSSLMMVR